LRYGPILGQTDGNFLTPSAFDGVKCDLRL
jgi:hypothetical protein